MSDLRLFLTSGCSGTNLGAKSLAEDILHRQRWGEMK